MQDFSEYLEASRRRLEQARRIADDLRHDRALHQLAMTAVFVLEDTYETLSRIRLAPQEYEQNRHP